MFRSSTIIRELVLSLAQVTHLRSYRLCGGVAACLESGVCVVQNGTEWRVCCVLCRMRLGVACVLCGVQNVRVNYSIKFKPSKFNKHCICW
jgi:hypothetical protein